MSQPTGVFISYRRTDTKWAAILLHSAIKQAFPAATVFHDGDTLKMGIKWPDRLRQGLQDCCVLLALVGEKWATQRHPHNDRVRLDIEEDWVRTEIDHALRSDKHVIPVLIDDAELPGDKFDLPSCLRPLLDCQSTRLRGPADSQSDIQRILDRLGELLPEDAKVQPRQKPSEAHSHTPGNMISIAEAADLITEAAESDQTLMAIANARYDAGRFGLAEAIFRRAFERLSESRGEQDDLTLTAAHNRATALLQLGCAEQAEAAFRDLIPLQETAHGSDHPDALNARHNHASALLSLGRAKEAEVAFRRLIPATEKARGQYHPDTLASRHAYACTLLELGRIAEALAAFCNLIELREQVQGPDHPGTLATRLQLARAALENNDVQMARMPIDRLPGIGGTTNLLRQGQTALLRAWLSDLDGDAATSDRLLNEADLHFAHLTSEQYARRELAKYRETRVPGGKGGTTLWASDN